MASDTPQTESAPVAAPAAAPSSARPGLLNSPPLTVFFSLGVVVIVLDQLTKLWVVRSFEVPDRGDAHVIIQDYLQIIFRVNTGAAFSIFTEHPEILAGFSTIVSTAVLVWAWRVRGVERVLRWPLGLVWGGAVGNLIDRFRIGHVIDFIDAHWHGRYHFPTFNVADSAISVGMVLLILLSLTAPPDQR